MSDALIPTNLGENKQMYQDSFFVKDLHSLLRGKDLSNPRECERVPKLWDLTEFRRIIIPAA